MGRLKLMVIAILCLLALSAIAKAADEHVIYLDNSGEPEYIDPALASDTASSPIVRNLFVGLAENHPLTLEPVPSLATSWDVSADGKIWTFHLRHDAKWSDGTPLTAKDFVYSWRRTINPATASSSAYIMYPVKNAEAINTGKLKDLSKLGIKALSPYELRVELERPTPYFPKLLPFSVFQPVKQEVVEKYGDKWTHPEYMVCSGPYVLKEWTIYKRIVAEKNPYYFNKDNVFVDKIIFTPMENRDTALKSYLSGTLDNVQKVSPVQVEKVRTRPDYHISPNFATYYYMYNTTKKPFNDVRVRQAFNMAVEKDTIVNYITKEGQIPADALTPPGVAGYYTAPPGLHFNPEKANQLLDEAGYKDRSTFPEVSILYNTMEQHKLIAQATQQMWKKYLGVNVKIINQEWKVLLKAGRAGDFDIIRSSWIGDYLDPTTFLEVFKKDSGQNYSQWSSAKYENLLSKASNTMDQKKHNELLYQAESLLLDEAPELSFYFYTTSYLINPKLQGFYMNALDIHPIQFVTLGSIWQHIAWQVNHRLTW